MFNKTHLLFLLLIVPFFLSAKEKTSLKVSFGLFNSPPYAFIESGKLRGGIIKDIATELAGQLDMNVEFINVPRKRAEQLLLDNKIHLILISNPQWFNLSENYDWSLPLFVEKDVIVISKNDGKKVSNFNDLDHLTLGTIHGYIYPNLTEMFVNGHVTRSDVTSLDLNFSRLHKGWIDAFIDSNILVNYQLKLSARANDFRIADLEVSQHYIQSALSKNAPVSIEQLNTQLQKLKNNGVIDTILDKYLTDKISQVTYKH